MKKMNKEAIVKIYNATVLNGGSSSVKGDGDYSILHAYNGYIVGGFSACIKAGANLEAFTKAITRMDKMLPSNAILGTWINEGQIYIERAKVVYDFDFAMELGKMNEQIAIFDIANQEDVKVV